jgi:hypothetical protein
MRFKNTQKEKRGLLLLDSLHMRERVQGEPKLYSSFVSPGNYIIVNDTHLELMNTMGATRVSATESEIAGRILKSYLRAILFQKPYPRRIQSCHTFQSAPTVVGFWQDPEILSHLSHELLEPQRLLRYKTVAGAVVGLCLAAQQIRRIGWSLT